MRSFQSAQSTQCSTEHCSTSELFDEVAKSAIHEIVSHGLLFVLQTDSNSGTVVKMGYHIRVILRGQDSETIGEYLVTRSGLEEVEAA